MVDARVALKETRSFLDSALALGALADSQLGNSILFPSLRFGVSQLPHTSFNVYVFHCLVI